MSSTAEIKAPALRLTDLCKNFNGVQAVRGVSFDASNGAYVCLLGPSGCGKTTILRSIAGFQVPDSGQIEIDGRDMSRVPPNHRRLGMVYQNYALFPHLSVRENVAFGLKMRNIGKAEREVRVDRALSLVHLQDFGHRRPKELSGGQQQRVALARAIVIEPQILLLDEPLSNLDAKLRKQMQLELKALQRRIGLTTIHVTHDQEEALTLADTLVILNHGQIVQIGQPHEVYANPTSVFVADFLGRANFLSGRAVRTAAGLAFMTEQGETLTSLFHNTVEDGDACKAFIRPERVMLHPGSQMGEANSLSGQVTDLVFSGSLLSLTIAIGGGRSISVERQTGANLENIAIGTDVAVTLPPNVLLVLPAD
jgi:spermidine/putrescine ABC transporter ATP-binding subunit